MIALTLLPRLVSSWWGWAWDMVTGAIATIFSSTKMQVMNCEIVPMQEMAEAEMVEVEMVEVEMAEVEMVEVEMASQLPVLTLTAKQQTQANVLTIVTQDIRSIGIKNASRM
jgi:hypothetical protein